MNECECHRCIQENKLTINHPVFGEILLSVTKMILCPECGNKRCPKASDHRLDCTNSNDEGQVKMEVIKATQYDDDPFGRSNTVAIVYRGDDGLRRTGFYTANHADAAEDLIKLLELSIDSQPDRKDFVDVPNEKGGITALYCLLILTEP